MELKDMYLILYNAVCCAGWALVWKNAVSSLVNNLTDSESIPLKDDEDGTNAVLSPPMSLPEALANVYRDGEADLVIGDYNLLFVTQMLAVLEILHSLLRLVRSPFMATFMQVMSRVVAVLAVFYSQDAQSKYIQKSYNTLLQSSMDSSSHLSHILYVDLSILGLSN